MQQSELHGRTCRVWRKRPHPSKKTVTNLVVLVLIGGLVIAGERALGASRETSAAQSVQSFAANETTYQRNWGGYSLDAKSLGGAGLTTPAICTQDEELVTTTGTPAFPAAYDTAGLAVQSGYKFQYASGQAAGFAGTGGCTQNVTPTYDFTANPVVQNAGKSFCADNTGTYYLPAGTAMANTGIGCLADNSAALAIGQ